ncbi:hypothetical protein [Paraburkholderia humisilvae]|uniref:Uncharacterized protein n=1 Tax=Paraburkholderia humisilvae TaxID=627669 RepID=A0A6J5ED01_9BURK|nr:hypothetical protein [Paraburkholderia humisilvae]CAB3764359.1 hypothetical protein LMG29542_04875 [Paraburkholderia humisilvae]
MSRIDSNQAAAQAAEAQQAEQAQRERAAHAHHGEKSAALYRGTTLFAHGSDAAHAEIQHSLKAKKMLARLFRRRAMLRNELKAAAAGKLRPAALAPHHDERPRVARPPGSRFAGLNNEHADRRVSPGDGEEHDEQDEQGGGGQQRDGGGNSGGNNGGSSGGSGSSGGGQGRDGQHGGQQRDSHSDDRSAVTFAVAKGVRGGGRGAAAPSRLGEVAAQFSVAGTEKSRADAVRLESIDNVLDLADALRANPRARVDVAMIDHSIALRSIERDIGRLPPAGLGAFVERDKARRAGPKQSVGGFTHAAPPGANNDEERASRVFALLPLLALNGDRPSPPSQLDSSIAASRSTRAALQQRQSADATAPTETAAAPRYPHVSGPGAL